MFIVAVGALVLVLSFGPPVVAQRETGYGPSEVSRLSGGFLSEIQRIFGHFRDADL